MKNIFRAFRYREGLRDDWSLVVVDIEPDK